MRFKEYLLSIFSILVKYDIPALYKVTEKDNVRKTAAFVTNTVHQNALIEFLF